MNSERIAWALIWTAIAGVLVLMLMAGYAIITHLPTPEPHYGH